MASRVFPLDPFFLEPFLEPFFLPMVGHEPEALRWQVKEQKYDTMRSHCCVSILNRQTDETSNEH